MKRQLSGLQNRFPFFSLFAPSVMQLPRARYEKSSRQDGLDGRNFVQSWHPKKSTQFSVLQANVIVNDICETAVIKEKRKDVRSQSKVTFIFVQTSYLFWLYVAIIRLNVEP